MSILLNPSLPHHRHEVRETKAGVALTYGRDSLFSRHAFGVAGSMRMEKGATLACLYRFLKHSDNADHKEVTLNVSDRLFKRSLTQGAVEIGINARFESANWRYANLDTLMSTKTVYDNSQPLDTIGVLDTFARDHQAHRTIKEQRLIFDLGFFQNGIAPNLDFGLTFHNLIGYTWRSEVPSVVDTLREVWNADFSHLDTLIDSCFYSSKPAKHKSWLAKHYKRLSCGVAYHAALAKGRVGLLVPFDAEVIGLFDKNQPIRFGFHSGVEGWIVEKICVRFGYARAPDYIEQGRQHIPNANILTGGLGLVLERLQFDVAVRREGWVMGVQIDI